MAATVVGSGQIAGTLTSKRITKRVSSTADAATITPDCDSYDLIDITAIAQAFTIANPTGTPTNGQEIRIRIKDNATARAITWGANYVEGTGTALPSTTVLSKILNLLFQYNTANSLNKWQLIGVAQESASAAGGLTNWSESAGTYSSKDWKRFYPVSGTNVNVVFSPLGTGSIQAQVADGTSTGGNQRGQRAVDLQMSRSSASMVASGDFSCIPGGKDNTVSGQSSFTACVNNNILGSSSFGLGANLTVSGSYAGGLGWGSTIGANYTILLGYGGLTGNVKGAISFSSGNISNGVRGASQGNLVVLSRITTDGTAGKELLTMYAFNTTASTSNQIQLSNNSTIVFHALICAHRTDTLSGLTNRSFWTAQGVAYRDANAASTGVSSTVTAVNNSPGYTAAADADTTNGCLRFKVTGTAGHTVRWHAFVKYGEVKS